MIPAHLNRNRVSARTIALAVQQGASAYDVGGLVARADRLFFGARPLTPCRSLGCLLPAADERQFLAGYDAISSQPAILAEYPVDLVHRIDAAHAEIAAGG